MTETKISYAQNAEDIVLGRALSAVEAGTYVDVGAADPIIDSVTYAFYLRGWRGLNIEPVPAFAAALRQARPEEPTVQIAAGSREGAIELTVFSGTGWSTTDEKAVGRLADAGHEGEVIDVPLMPLDRVLEREGFADREIHFLKVDVEGQERDVLEGIDLNRWKPWIVVVEATEPASTTPTHHQWEDLLTSAGYKFCLFDGLNRFYLSPEHPELETDLSYPAGVFDQPFVSWSVASERDGYVTELARLRAELVDHDAAAAAHDRQSRELAEQLSVATRRADAAAQRALQFARQTASIREENLTFRSRLALTAGRLGEIEHRCEELMGERDAYHARLLDANAHLEAVFSSISWKVAGPLRKVRRVQLARKRPKLAPGVSSTLGSSAETKAPDTLDEAAARATAGFALRTAQVIAVLQGADRIPTRFDGPPPIEELTEAIAGSTATDNQIAWLTLVGADASYPDEVEMSRAARSLRLGGPGALVAQVIVRYDRAIAEHRAPENGLDVRRDTVVIDVGHTATHDLHTGIQRVVRQLASRWFQRDEFVAIHWNHRDSAIKALRADEVEKFVKWRDHMHAPGTGVGSRSPQEANEQTLVPWNCTLVVPELAAEPPRCSGYRTLAVSGVLAQFSVLGYDIIPITAAETVAEGMPGVFANYLSMLKYADRVSAISEASAVDFSAFCQALGSQGITGPDVRAHSLPADEPVPSAVAAAALRKELGLGDSPLVLVVGSHEPRKNHLAVLEAAERLWRSGEWFDLVLMGGSGWRSEEFEAEVSRLLGEGFPVKVLRRVSEDQLWAGYAMARFTVFPSIVEGYGLPIAESLICGTPVITSNYGSMGEVAAGGGAVVVDPRRPDQLEAAMRELLCDDGVLDRLRKEAAVRRWKTWDEYADEVWDHLAVTGA